MKAGNKDKIKVLELAIEYVKNGDVNIGICDGLNFSCGDLPSDPKFYGMTLPPREYEYLRCYAFSFPLTRKGKAQRIKFLQEAIKRLRK